MNIQELTTPSNLTKSYRAAQVERLMANLAEGYENPLEAYVVIKHLQDLLTSMEKNVQPLALNEAAKFAKGDGSTLGVSFKVVSKVGAYKYDHDEEWVSLKSELKAREQDMQAAYKAQERNRVVLSEATGEVVPPAAVTTTEYIQFDWPK